MKKYISKKDTSIIAILEKDNDKYGTVTLCYETGPNVGRAFDITKSTLKRWWTEKLVDPTVEEILNLDMNKIVEPYPEPKPSEQKYIEKPQSVIDYETKKRYRNENFPSFEQLPDAFVANDIVMKRINKEYITMFDISKVKRKTACITILASDYVAGYFVNKGFKSQPCIERGTPFRFDIKSKEEYDLMIDIFKTITNNEKEKENGKI